MFCHRLMLKLFKKKNAYQWAVNKKLTQIKKTSQKKQNSLEMCLSTSKKIIV